MNWNEKWTDRDDWRFQMPQNRGYHHALCLLSSLACLLRDWEPFLKFTFPGTAHINKFLQLLSQGCTNPPLTQDCQSIRFIKPLLVEYQIKGFKEDVTDMIPSLGSSQFRGFEGRIPNIYEIYLSILWLWRVFISFSLILSFPRLHKILFSFATLPKFLELSIPQSLPCYFLILYTFKHLWSGRYFKKESVGLRSCHRLESDSETIFQWVKMHLWHNNHPHPGQLKE